MVVLKRSGADFKHAMKVLDQLDLEQPLPPRAVLKEIWVATATERDGVLPLGPTRSESSAVLNASLDGLVRDRSWHRVNETSLAAPTLATITANTPVNHAYVVTLSTVEFQRLVLLLGPQLPAWVDGLRGSSGLRALMETPGYARLNLTRIAGMRLGGWLIGAAGVAVAWVVGLRTGTWW